MIKKILHISSDFAYQKIYINLVRELSRRGYNQVVYTPVRWEHLLDGNRDDLLANVEYHYSYVLKRNFLFKLRYFRKINTILNDAENKVNFGEIRLVHAHFLFSDGGVAYLLKKKYNIPYIVSVRSSDIFVFYKFMLHLRKFGNNIMKEAENVVFINPTYKEYFLENYMAKAHQSIKNKMCIIPNAIDDKWFINVPSEKKIEPIIRVLYVGKIIKRKKLDVLIKAISKLNNLHKRKFILEVVGVGDFMNTVKQISDENVIFHGEVKNFDDLLAIYRRCHIFAMPSIRETFGLVYIEALSQGLPIIYCQNEAVDGFFTTIQVGCAVKPNSVKAIIQALDNILLDYNRLSQNAILASRKFTIKENANLFVKLYENRL